VSSAQNVSNDINGVFDLDKELDKLQGMFARDLSDSDDGGDAYNEE
jgi:hypothetical protein